MFGRKPDTNNIAMGPDAPLPTDEKISLDDQNEKAVDDGESIKRNASAINPMDALGFENVREIEKKVVTRLDMTLLPSMHCGFQPRSV